MKRMSHLLPVFAKPKYIEESVLLKRNSETIFYVSIECLQLMKWMDWSITAEIRAMYAFCVICEQLVKIAQLLWGSGTGRTRPFFFLARFILRGKGKLWSSLSRDGGWLKVCFLSAPPSFFQCTAGRLLHNRVPGCAARASRCCDLSPQASLSELTLLQYCTQQQLRLARAPLHYTTRLLGASPALWRMPVLAFLSSGGFGV